MKQIAYSNHGKQFNQIEIFFIKMKTRHEKKYILERKFLLANKILHILEEKIPRKVGGKKTKVRYHIERFDQSDIIKNSAFEVFEIWAQV